MLKRLLRRLNKKKANNKLKRHHLDVVRNSLGQVKHPAQAHQDFWSGFASDILNMNGLRDLFEELDTSIFFFENEAQFSQAFVFEDASIIAINFHQIAVLTGLYMDQYYDCAQDRYHYYGSSMGRIKIALDSFLSVSPNGSTWFQAKTTSFDEDSLSRFWDSSDVVAPAYLAKIVPQDKVDLQKTSSLIFAFLLGHEFGHCIHAKRKLAGEGLFGIGTSLFKTATHVMRTNATMEQSKSAALKKDARTPLQIQEALKAIDDIDGSISEEIMCDFIGELFLASAAHKLGFSDREVVNLCYVLPTQLITWSIDLNLLQLSILHHEDKNLTSAVQIASSKKDRLIFVKSFIHGFALPYIRQIVRGEVLTWTERTKKKPSDNSEELFELQQDYIAPYRFKELFSALFIWEVAVESFLHDPNNPNAEVFKGCP
ncbi:hypothetical protein N9M66_00365 [Litoreibacter sp.]|nr:hypothetical protein [Litoreibacter sp.]